MALRRCLVLFALAAQALLASGALARTLGTVVFQPSPAQLLAAATGPGPQVVDPLPASDTIRLSVPPFVDAVSASVSGLPQPGVDLLATCTKNAQNNGSGVVVGTAPGPFCDATQLQGGSTTLSLEARMTGSVPAGTYNATLTLRYSGTKPKNHGRWSGSDQTTIEFIVPPFVVLRVVGGDTVSFDYARDPSAFVKAWGGTLPPTPASTTLQGIEVYGNAGYLVTVAAAPNPANPPGAPAVSALEILGRRMSATPVTIASRSSPTPAPQTIATPSDYALAVGSSETAGSYAYAVTYVAVVP